MTRSMWWMWVAALLVGCPGTTGDDDDSAVDDDDAGDDDDATEGPVAGPEMVTPDGLRHRAGAANADVVWFQSRFVDGDSPHPDVRIVAEYRGGDVERVFHHVEEISVSVGPTENDTIQWDLSGATPVEIASWTWEELDAAPVEIGKVRLTAEDPQGILSVSVDTSNDGEPWGYIVSTGFAAELDVDSYMPIPAGHDHGGLLSGVVNDEPGDDMLCPDGEPVEILGAAGVAEIALSEGLDPRLAQWVDCLSANAVCNAHQGGSDCDFVSEGQ